MNTGRFTVTCSILCQEGADARLIRMRRDLIVMASICTATVLELSGVGSMMVSRYALKEGMLASLVRK